MTDEQNDRDIARMNAKRARALKILEEFKVWHNVNDSDGNYLVISGLYLDIFRGTEAEVDRITEIMEEKNQQALMEKLGQGVE